MNTHNENKTHKDIWSIIIASSLGTAIEWYDFFIFGILASIISAHFFPSTDPVAALLSTLATFSAGFIARPFGAIVFGRLGDIIGRKYTFMLTLLIMGGSTFLIGIVPDYATIGYAAPVIVLILRLLQGLAIGGEYGGAATYVSEHVENNRRGFYTGWIQVTAGIALLIAVGVILISRKVIGIAEFNDWGWRFPFWISVLLVGVSIYMRLKMSESPLFAKLKTEGKTSVNPLKESFAHKGNMKMVLLALFGVVMGQGAVWYTSHFYIQTFIEAICKIEFEQTRMIMVWAIIITAPTYVIAGSLSDKIGRKWIMMIGMVLAVVTYRPIFQQILDTADHTTKTLHSKEVTSKKAIVIGKTADSLITKVQVSTFTDGMIMTENITDTVYAAKEHKPAKPVIKSVKTFGTSSYWYMVFLVILLIIYAAMIYGPMAAYLVELFPTKIRYTSLSLPYHLGNLIGGLTPFISALLTVTFSADKLSGLWYPIGVTAICCTIGSLYIINRYDQDINN